MSFHSGIYYEQVQGNLLRQNISLDMYFFILSGIVNHDLMHCDLHNGNWKVQLEEDGSHKLVIYDFGLMASVHDPSISQTAVMSLFGDDFTGISRIMVLNYSTHPKHQEYLAYLKEVHAMRVGSYADRYMLITRKALDLRLPLNMNIVRFIQGIMICMRIVNVSRSKLNKVLGDTGRGKEITLCYNVGLLRKTKKYAALMDVFNQWLDKEPDSRKKYMDWIFDTFGHRDDSVFVDITIDGLVF
jgi:hypothetical protein